MPDDRAIEPAEPRQVLISVNPTAGRGRAGRCVDELVQRLEQHGLPASVLTDLDEVAERADSLHREGQLRALVGAGGDGTAAELVNRTSPGVPLALLPLGTENLLAKYLNQSPSAEAVCQTIVDGVRVTLDAGKANGRIFLLMVGCGFDAEVIRQLELTRSGNITHWAYFKPIVAAIRSYQYPPLRVYLDGADDCDDTGDDTEDESKIECRWAFAFNLPCYAWGLPFAREAVGTDSLLDICTFRRGGVFSGMWYLTNLVLRRHARMSDCETRRAGRLRIESDEPVPYQIDGDLGGVLPLEVQLLPGRLTLLASRDWADAHQARRR